MPNHTRRIPPNIEPAGLSQDARMTPDARFMVFSSRAANLPGANMGFLQVYRFEQGAEGAGGILVHVSRTSTGASAGADCLMPSISDNGTLVAFHTKAKLVPNDTDSVQDVYFVDLTNPNAPVVTCATFPRPGVVGVRGNSNNAAISGNGQFIAFTSAASDLLTDTNGTTRDVFRYTMADPDAVPPVLEAVELASVNNSSVQSAMPFSTIGDELGCPAPLGNLRVGSVISNDGSRVVFCGTPCDWQTADLCPACSFSNCNDCVVDANCTNCSTEGNQQVYLRDFARADQGLTATFRVSTRPCIVNMKCDAVVAGDACSRRPSISGDGSRIAFSSLAQQFRNDESVDPDFFEDVFFIDVMTIFNSSCLAPTLVSVPVCEPLTVDGHSFQPMLSTDGLRIAFASDNTRLLPITPPPCPCSCPDTNMRRDIFIRVTLAAVTVRFSVSSAGEQGNNNSMNPDVSGDGMIALYQSVATNLLGPNVDMNGVQDIFQSPSPQGPFIRGDVDLNGRIEINDAIRITNWLFQGGVIPACLDSADADDDGDIELSDAVFISSFLFQGGPAPACPFCCSPTTSCCGRDPTGDGLPCGQSLSPCTPFSVTGSCP
jgi:Tol biopolymer transport system component